MKQTRWKSFLGGNDIIYTLIIGVLASAFLFLVSQLGFIFGPIVTIISSILMPFIISILLYYLLVPIIDFLERNKIKRIWGVVLLYIILAFLLTGVIAILFPLLLDQVVSLINNFPSFVNDIIDSVITFVNSNIDNQQLQNLAVQFESFASNFFNNIFDYIIQGLSSLTSLISSITSFVITLVTVPIILFFLLKDNEQFFNGFLKIVPPKWRADILQISHEINTQVGAYIKGQLTVAVITGVLMMIGFSLIGLNYSGILAIAGGLASIIPYVGPTVTFIPALIIAVIDSWTTVLLLIIVWGIIQIIQGNFIEPNIMGKQLEVHPITIIVVLIVMGDLIGLLGVLFGIPIYAIIKVVVGHIFGKIKIRYNKHYGSIAGEYHVQKIDAVDFGDDNINKSKRQFLQKIINGENYEPNTEKDESNN